MGGADLFRSYAQQSAQAAQAYTQHPITRQVVADMKTQYDTRQRNADAARSLEAFFRLHDLGDGAVRLEDFKAGWALGGVKISPHQMSCIRGAYGNENGSIRYSEVIEAMDALGYEQGLSIVMTGKMGSTTAKHLGYTQGNPVVPGYMGHISRSQSMGGHVSGPVSPNSLMRSTNITPVSQPVTGSAQGTYNVTSVINNLVTQRHKSMTPPNLVETLDRIKSASVLSSEMATTLQALDTGNTGCVTLDAFLTACARAGLTLRPDELDALRQNGKLRRPYDAAPELVDFAHLEIMGV